MSETVGTWRQYRVYLPKFFFNVFCYFIKQINLTKLEILNIGNFVYGARILLKVFIA